MTAQNHLVFKPGLASASRAEDRSRSRDERRRPPRPAPTACEQCGREGLELTRYRMNSMERSEGSASVHVSVRWLCSDCAPQRKREKEIVKTEAELRSILKMARRGLR